MAWLAGNPPEVGELFFGGGGVVVTPNQYTQSFIDGGWVGSSSDIIALNTLTNELLSIPTISTSKDAGTLFLAPCVGSSPSDRLRCIFHPTQAVGYQMPTTIDSSLFVNSLKGDGNNYVDTGYDGTGLNWHDISTVVHGRGFRYTRSDENQYTVYGRATKINGETSIFKSGYSNKIRSGSTFNFANGGYCESDGFQSGTFGSVCLGTATDKQRAWRNDVLASQVTSVGTYGFSGAGTSTFKLLANDLSDNKGTTAEIHTVMICKGLPNDEYLLAQAAINKFNLYRSTYNNAAKSTGPFKLWIFAGQSNAVGQQVGLGTVNNISGDILDDNNQNAYSWLRDNTGFEDLHMAADFDVGTGAINIGAYMSMFNTMLASNNDQRLALVPTAKGATGFSSNDWNPTDTLYETHLAMINAAVAAGGEIAGMVWVQGEGDVSLTTQEYVTAWNAMFNDMKARIVGGWPANAKVILGQVANPTWYNNARYQQIVAENANTVYVTQTDAGVDLLADAMRWDEADKLHYSAVAQRLMGIAYANQAI